jgi:hypothetical protein
MAQVADEIQQKAPPDPLSPTETRIPSSFNTALDTVSDDAPAQTNEVDVSKVHLAETFLGIAESLRKPRGWLMR